MIENIIGFTAGVLMSISALPQLFKSYRTKKVGDISFAMLLIIMAALILWIIYAIMIGSWPIILMDSFGFCANMVLIVMKMKYNK